MSTLVGTDTIDIVDSLPMAYTYKDGIVKGLQRVHPAKIDAMFLDRWSEFSFKYAGMTMKKGDGQYGKTKHRTIVVSTRLLTDREKLELAKQLLGE